MLSNSTAVSHQQQQLCWSQRQLRRSSQQQQLCWQRPLRARRGSLPPSIVILLFHGRPSTHHRGVLKPRHWHFAEVAEVIGIAICRRLLCFVGCVLRRLGLHMTQSLYVQVTARKYNTHVKRTNDGAAA